MNIKTTIENGILTFTDTIPDNDDRCCVLEDNKLDRTMYTNHQGSRWVVNNLAALMNCLILDHWYIEIETKPYTVMRGRSIDQFSSSSCVIIKPNCKNYLKRWHAGMLSIESDTTIYTFSTSAIAKITAKKITGFKDIDTKVTIPTIEITHHSVQEHKFNNYNLWNITATTTDTRYFSKIFEAYKDPKRPRSSWDPEVITNDNLAYTSIFDKLGYVITNYDQLYHFLLMQGIYRVYEGRSELKSACDAIANGEVIIVNSDHSGSDISVIYVDMLHSQLSGILKK